MVYLQKTANKVFIFDLIPTEQQLVLLNHVGASYDQNKKCWYVEEDQEDALRDIVRAFRIPSYSLPESLRQHIIYSDSSIPTYPLSASAPSMASSSALTYPQAHFESKGQSEAPFANSSSSSSMSSRPRPPRPRPIPITASLPIPLSSVENKQSNVVPERPLRRDAYTEEYTQYFLHPSLQYRDWDRRRLIQLNRHKHTNTEKDYPQNIKTETNERKEYKCETFVCYRDSQTESLRLGQIRGRAANGWFVHPYGTDPPDTVIVLPSNTIVPCSATTSFERPPTPDFFYSMEPKFSTFPLHRNSCFAEKVFDIPNRMWYVAKRRHVHISMFEKEYQPVLEEFQRLVKENLMEKEWMNIFTSLVDTVHVEIHANAMEDKFTVRFYLAQRQSTGSRMSGSLSARKEIFLSVQKKRQIAWLMEQLFPKETNRDLTYTMLGLTYYEDAIKTYMNKRDRDELSYDKEIFLRRLLQREGDSEHFLDGIYQKIPISGGRCVYSSHMLGRLAWDPPVRFTGGLISDILPESVLISTLIQLICINSVYHPCGSSNVMYKLHDFGFFGVPHSESVDNSKNTQSLQTELFRQGAPQVGELLYTMVEGAPSNRIPPLFGARQENQLRKRKMGEELSLQTVWGHTVVPSTLVLLHDESDVYKWEPQLKFAANLKYIVLSSENGPHLTPNSRLFPDVVLMTIKYLDRQIQKVLRTKNMSKSYNPETLADVEKLFWYRIIFDPSVWNFQHAHSSIQRLCGAYKWVIVSDKTKESLLEITRTLGCFHQTEISKEVEEQLISSLWIEHNYCAPVTPTHIFSRKNVLYYGLSMSQRQKDVYNKARSMYLQLAPTEHDKRLLCRPIYDHILQMLHSRQFRISSLIDTLLQLVKHDCYFDQSISECSICGEEKGNDQSFYECKHVVCNLCWDQIEQKAELQTLDHNTRVEVYCPQCRVNVSDQTRRWLDDLTVETYMDGFPDQEVAFDTKFVLIHREFLSLQKRKYARMVVYAETKDIAVGCNDYMVERGVSTLIIPPENLGRLPVLEHPTLFLTYGATLRVDAEYLIFLYRPSTDLEYSDVEEHRTLVLYTKGTIEDKLVTGTDTFDRGDTRFVIQGGFQNIRQILQDITSGEKSIQVMDQLML